MTDETTQGPPEMPEPTATNSDPAAAQPAAVFETTPTAGYPVASTQAAAPKGDHRVLVALVAGLIAGMLLAGMAFAVPATLRRIGAGFGGRGAMMRQRQAEGGWGYHQGNGNDQRYGNGPMMRGYGDRDCGGQNDPRGGNGGSGGCPYDGGRGYYNGTPSRPGTLPVTPDTTL